MNLFGLPLGGYAKTLMAQHAQWQADVIRVCFIYPHKVSVEAMSTALRDLNMDPQLVYLKLAEGSRIPRLDEALGVKA